MGRLRRRRSVELEGVHNEIHTTEKALLSLKVIMAEDM